MDTPIAVSDRRPLGALLLVALAACGQASTSPPAGSPRAEPSPAATPSPAALTLPLDPIAAEAGGEVGVAVVHVESGRRTSLRGGERFPMASVYKVPIAIAFLRRVDAGQASLDQEVSYGASDLRPGLANSEMNARARSGKATATARELVEAMLVQSDNTASDLVLRLAGGPDAVTAFLREKGIEGVDVSRPEGRILLDYWGVASPPPPSEWTLGTFARLRREQTAEARRTAAQRFASDTRDTATPEGMALLLARLQRGELVSPSSTAFLLDAMTRATTGPGRLKGLLPAGTPVAHKTGTGGDTAGVNCCTNDVGIITLPGGEHLAVAVFVRSSPRPLAARERAIARVAEVAYEHWAKNAGPASQAGSPGGGGEGDGTGSRIGPSSSGGGVAIVGGGSSGHGAGAATVGVAVGRGEAEVGVGRADDGVNERSGGVSLGSGVSRGRTAAGARVGTVGDWASGTGEGGRTTGASGSASGVVRERPRSRTAEGDDVSGSTAGAPLPAGAALTMRMMIAATSAAANMLASQA